MATDKVCKND